MEQSTCQLLCILYSKSESYILVDGESLFHLHAVSVVTEEMLKARKTLCPKQSLRHTSSFKTSSQPAKSMGTREIG